MTGNYALVGWHPDGTPYSRHFGDVYFTRGDGLAESRFVFLDRNRLDERFAATDRVFTIGETGFGTGLNFLAAWQLFAATAPAGRVLEYHSCEKYPLRPEALTKALTAWPELAPLAAQLGAAYRPWTVSRMVFSTAMHRICLHLHFGDVRDVLPHFSGTVDAWFLDGFAPASNADMWQADLLQVMHAKTRPGGTLATFTAAGKVKRGLEAAGFVVNKVPGYGRKREMLTATRPPG